MSQTSAPSASFTVGAEDVNMTEIRQRRLQRFHSLPISQPGRRDDGGESSESGLAGIETGVTGETGIGGGEAAVIGDSADTES